MSLRRVQFRYGRLVLSPHNHHHSPHILTTRTHTSYTSCFDEPRAKIVAQDVVKWFRKEYGTDACNADFPSSKKFDVIILDLLDPELLPELDFATWLYSDAVRLVYSCPCACHVPLVRCGACVDVAVCVRVRACACAFMRLMPCDPFSGLP